MLNIAVLPKGGGDSLAFFSRIDKHKAFLSTGVLIDISNARICIFGGLGSLFFQDRKGILDILTLGGLNVLYIEVLHAQPPFASLDFDFGDYGFPPGA